MFSIGELSKRTKVKVPTIRYYEEMGLLAAPERTEGNQRRYDMAGLERLSFIKHSRDLGFSIEAISDLIELQGHPELPLAPLRLRHVRPSSSRTEPFIFRLRQVSGNACDSMGPKHRRGGSEKCFLRWARLFQMTTKGKSID